MNNNVKKSVINAVKTLFNITKKFIPDILLKLFF